MTLVPRVTGSDSLLSSTRTSFNVFFFSSSLIPCPSVLLVHCGTLCFIFMIHRTMHFHEQPFEWIWNLLAVISMCHLFFLLSSFSFASLHSSWLTMKPWRIHCNIECHEDRIYEMHTDYLFTCPVIHRARLLRWLKRRKSSRDMFISVVICEECKVTSHNFHNTIIEWQLSRRKNVHLLSLVNWCIGQLDRVSS